MNKKIVHYVPSPDDIIIRGNSAWVRPTDHPDRQRVTNTKNVLTSTVLHVRKNGVFETLNTIYKPQLKKVEIVK